MIEGKAVRNSYWYRNLDPWTSISLGR